MFLSEKISGAESPGNGKLTMQEKLESPKIITFDMARGLSVENKKQLLPITTERLIIQLPNENDAETILRWSQQKTVEKFAFFKQKITLEKETAYMRQKLESPTDLIMTMRLRETNEIIGTVGLLELDFANNNCRLGILIGSLEYHGKGYGTETINSALELAFTKLNMHQVYLHVFAENAKAQNLYKKIGFRANGVLPERYNLDGQYKDYIYMYFLKSGWVNKEGLKSKKLQS